MERRQTGQNTSSDPHRILSFWRCNNLNFHGGRSEGGHLLLYSVGYTWKHGATTGEHRVGIEILPDVDVTPHYGVVRCLVYTGGFHPDQRRLEYGFWASEPLVSYGYDLSVGELVRFLVAIGRGRLNHVGIIVQSHETDLLLEISYDLTLGRRGETVASFGENLHQVIGEVSPGEVQSKDGVWKGVT